DLIVTGVQTCALPISRPGEALQLRPEVGPRVAADRDVVELGGGQPGVRETPGGRERGEAGAVLDAVEALLLGGGDELAVDDERGRSVAVKGVQAEDRRHRPDASRLPRRGPV